MLDVDDPTEFVAGRAAAAVRVGYHGGVELPTWTNSIGWCFSGDLPEWQMDRYTWLLQTDRIHKAILTEFVIVSLPFF